ncbi:MAG: ABC transporter permease, partial [Bacteroidota bacterium]
MKSRDSPPRAAERLLVLFVKGPLQEEILGDLQEYYDDLSQEPRSKRKLFYWFHVLHFLRPFALKKLQTIHPNTTTMLRHSLLISLRNFKRYPASFLINTVGLSSALACVVLIYLWVDDELSVDKFHEHGDHLYHVMVNMDFPRGMQTTPNTSGLLGPLMEEELPEIDQVVRVAKYMEGAMLSHGEKIVKADGHFVTGDFFKVFSFKLIHGDKDNLWSNPDGLLISKSLANKLFPSERVALGQIVSYQNEKNYAVSGVFEDVPNHSSERFDFLLSYEQTASGENDELLDWGSQSTELYITLQPGTDIDAFNEKIKGFIGEQNERGAYRLPFATKYEDKYLQGTYENGEQVGGRIEYVRFFSLIAVFIMGIACINFMNLATARASRRFKEIGIKKVAGAKRSTLASQYLLEAVLVALVSLALALIIVLLVLPIFNQITGKQLHLRLSLEFASLLLGLAVGTGILSGSYPALYLSRFKPIAILKGRLNASTGELWTRRG